jgi:hypothetical protein
LELEESQPKGSQGLGPQQAAELMQGRLFVANWCVAKQVLTLLSGGVDLRCSD